ncbi:Heavy metal sensor kinase [Pseudomonas syringae pv. aptata]|uniref:histidine kinase n=1 Tax=Pseudomonas syringae pv. aptata TaxID=83167 RepID=A0A3M5X048_PSEAP|nr:Heavy metal sensor kinase [Pseudomonas syringae pv. aptata]
MYRAAPIEKPHLRRALINLLHNAVQHTGAGEVIEVNIESRDAHVTVSVTNPGVQIAQEHLPRLFERFYRVDASRSNSGANHGLGLAIVKAIALMHGGTVFVNSAKGANTFGIQLPR